MNPLRTFLGLCALAPILVAGCQSTTIDEPVALEPQTYVFGIEMDGTVCGYAEFHVTTEESDGEEYTLLKHYVLMERSALGSDITTTLDLTYHIDPETEQFTYHDSHILSGDMDLSSQVVVEGNVAHMSGSLDGKTQTLELPEGVLRENTMFFPTSCVTSSRATPPR